MRRVNSDAYLTQRKCLDHPFYHLEVHLKRGAQLVVRDSSGSSDPYVIFKVGKKQLYKSKTVSKNLNPLWDERFTLPIEDPSATITAHVLDYDRGLRRDDPMGFVTIDLNLLDLNKLTELKLNLKPENPEKVKEDYMGYLVLQVKLIPKSLEEKEEIMACQTNKVNTL
ncbi:DgyrCDS7893 [Dimorphilus gyrociliatus]|uniref:DgyrCDS7893 n=1 Tax=Dimorphilus gyrociliatus TaxID=2664684 RepID=A0A7I8VU66_9ANNE|nr:DgyrCDS7893 [Dimorphilus gyrociliatus]